MIRLDDTEPDTPEWNDWREECSKHQDELNRMMARLQHGADEPKPKIQQRIYAKLKEQHFAAEQAPFWGKCAYCEQHIRSSQFGDIDHFRPKGRVTEVGTGTPIKTRDGLEDHPGYYWLAYDWRNLLFACVLCNRPTKRTKSGHRIGKRDHFPLMDESKRAEAPGDERDETPLLINPLIEDPEDHLATTPQGVLYAVDESPRGQACIDLLGLNERGLCEERARVYRDTWDLFFLYFSAVKERHQAMIVERRAQLENRRLGFDRHAIAARQAIRDFKKLLVDQSKDFPC
ncbi:MAG: hypothetical protein AAGF11_35980 [Myxococcota bacterium]